MNREKIYGSCLRDAAFKTKVLQLKGIVQYFNPTLTPVSLSRCVFVHLCVHVCVCVVLVCFPAVFNQNKSTNVQMSKSQLQLPMIKPSQGTFDWLQQPH